MSSSNEAVRIFNVLSWQEQYAFDHSLVELTSLNTGELINIYMEIDTQLEGSYYEPVQRPFVVPRVDSKRGVIICALSCDAKYCAAVCASSPRCVWIWDLSDYNLNSILVQISDVSDLSWCPKSKNLNISTLESSKLYLWSPRGASVCQVPIPSNQKEASDF